MAARQSRRLLKPIIYTSVAAALGGGVLYISYRPRNIPGSDPAVVPPPSYGEEGTLIPPRFPLVKSREEQIVDLKRSAGGVRQSVDKLARKGTFGGVFGSSADREKAMQEDDAAGEQSYDLLIIGGGATGSGIALDAATRGLKVAVVERDDFSSGTSSKSTKLVHGGVRYLEKAVWELDYNQYASTIDHHGEVGMADSREDISL